MPNLYYPSGTTFPFAVPSAFTPGEFLFGNDSVSTLVGPSGQGLLSPLGNGFSGTVTVSQILIASGNPATATNASGISLYIGAYDQGKSASITPNAFRVVDVSGVTGTLPVTITPMSPATINGSSSAIVMSGTNYQVLNFLNVAPDKWIKY